MAYTADNLLSAIERKSFAPSGQSTYSNADILAMADEGIMSELMPDILAVREEFFVFTKDFSIVASQSEYLIPPRAASGVLRDVRLVGVNGGTKDLTRIEPDDRDTTNEGSPHSYYLQDNKIVVYPTPNSSTNTLKVSFFLERGALVEASSGAVISAINTSTNVVTVTTIPSTWATGNSFDLISKGGSHSYKDIDLTSTLVSGNDITLPSLPSSLVVGDYINLAEQSSVVQLPSSYRSVLAQLVAAEILDNMNQAGAKQAKEKTQLLKESARSIITPRVQGDTRVITPKNWF